MRLDAAMKFQLFFGSVFLTWLEFFSLDVFANVRSTQYKRQFGSNNVNAILCGARASQNEYVSVKIPQDNNEHCEGLSHAWLLDKQYDNGFDYIEKEKVVDVFKPPLEQRQDIDNGPVSYSFKWILPSSFDVGASLTLNVTISTQWDEIHINIFDTIKENLNFFDADPEILMHHLVFRTNGDNVQANYYNQNGWGDSPDYVTPLPVTNGHTHTIVIEAHSDLIRTVIDGNPTLEVSHAIPPISAAILEIKCIGTSPLYIHSITMDGDL